MKSDLQLTEEILHQLRLVVYHVIYTVLYIPGGAGFLLSTVWVKPCLIQYTYFWNDKKHWTKITWKIIIGSKNSGYSRHEIVTCYLRNLSFFHPWSHFRPTKTRLMLVSFTFFVPRHVFEVLHRPGENKTRWIFSEQRSFLNNLKHPTPLKTNIDNQTDDLEEVSPFKTWLFGVSMFLFEGVSLVFIVARVTTMRGQGDRTSGVSFHLFHWSVWNIEG